MAVVVAACLDPGTLAMHGTVLQATHVLIAYSAADEYVPGSVDKSALLRRLRAAMQGVGTPGTSGTTATPGAAVPVVVPVLIGAGDHALYAQEAAQQFVSAAAAFLSGRSVPLTLA